MKAKRFFLLLLSGMILFAGCIKKEVPTKDYPELFGEIKYYADLACIFSERQPGHKMQFVDEPFTEESPTSERIWDDHELQEAIKSIACRLPLDNDAAILAYAWELQPILQERSYIPSDYFPTHACRYSNGVVQITYLNDQYVEYASNPKAHWGEYLDIDIYAYVNETNGHLIYYFSYLD